MMLVLGSLGLVTEIVGTAMLVQGNSRITSEAMVQIVFQFVGCILHLVFNALLVHGVNTNKRGMILAWLIYTGIITGLQSLGVAIGFIISCIAGIWWLILIVVGVAALVGLCWYWFVVVLHFYQETREQTGFVYGKRENQAL